MAIVGNPYPGGCTISGSTTDTLTPLDLSGLMNGDLIVWNAGAGEWMPFSQLNPAMQLTVITNLGITRGVPQVQLP